MSQFSRGSALADLGRHAESIVALQRSEAAGLLAGAAGRKLHTLMALAYAHEQLPGKALDAVTTGLLRFPGDFELLFTEAQLRAAGGEYARAEECMRSVLSARTRTRDDGSDPSVAGPRARYMLALLCGLQDKYKDAEEEARASAMEEPGYLPTWLVLADALAGQDRVGEIADLVSDDKMPPLARSLVRACLSVLQSDLATAAKELEAIPASAEPLLGSVRAWAQEAPRNAEGTARIIAILPGGARLRRASAPA